MHRNEKLFHPYVLNDASKTSTKIRDYSQSIPLVSGQDQIPFVGPDQIFFQSKRLTVKKSVPKITSQNYGHCNYSKLTH